MNPTIPTDSGASQNTANIVAYFENARRVANYIPIATAWRDVANSLAQQGIQPPPPPVPPFSVIGYTDSTGSAATKETNDYVYPMPDPIAAKIMPSGTPGVDATCYQFPMSYTPSPGRIMAKTHADTVPLGTVVQFTNLPNIIPGSYKRGELPPGSMFGGGAQAIYDPA